MKILHFGAGKIGRGLIFPAFYEKHEVVLIDSNVDLVRLIRKNHGYKIIELESGSKNIIHIKDPNIQSYCDYKAQYNYDIITTSVIPKNIPEILPKIVDILLNNKRPLYIIPMENTHDAKNMIKLELEKQNVDLSEVHFLGSVIDRIVPVIYNELVIICEKYYSVIIENRNEFGKFFNSKNNLTDNYNKEFDKKLLLVNGLHACLAYLGHIEKYSYTHEAMKDNNIYRKLISIGECYIQYLVSNYLFDNIELEQYLKNSLKRFSNSSIKDPLSRVGRNLLIKMSNNERIIRPYLYNRKYGLKCKPLEEVIIATKYFDIANDYEDYIKLKYWENI